MALGGTDVSARGRLIVKMDCDREFVKESTTNPSGREGGPAASIIASLERYCDIFLEVVFF